MMVYNDLKRIIYASVAAILLLVGVMFFSPLSLQFNDADAVRGSCQDMNINDFVDAGQAECALNIIDSLIGVKGKKLPRFAFFDRYLPEDERMNVANARADIYELQWKRIEILKATNQDSALCEALEDYVNVIGYNQETAEMMLKQLNDK